MKSFIEKAITYGIYVFVFTIPWQTRLILRPGEIGGGYSEYLTLSLYATDILLAGLLGLGVLLSLRARRRSNPDANSTSTGLLRLRARNDIFYLFFLAWCALSILWAPDKALAGQFVFRLGLAGGLVWLVRRYRVSWRALAWAFLLGLVIPAGLAIAQFLFQSAPANKWLGLAAHRPYDLGQSVIETADGTLGFARDGRWLRAYGPFDHPNILGAVMAIALLAALVLAVSEERRFRRGLVLALVPLYAFAGFFSFSRSAWLALALGLALSLAVFTWRRRYMALKISLYFILVLGLTVFVVNDISDPLATARFNTGLRLENKSLAERADSLEAGWQAVKEKPFVGTGAGNFIAYLSQTAPGQPAYAYQPPHNTLLLLWSEIGAIGLFLALFLTYMTINRGVRQLGIVLPGAIFLLFMLDHWWWSLHFGLYFIALVLLFREDEFNKIS